MNAPAKISLISLLALLLALLTADVNAERQRSNSGTFEVIINERDTYKLSYTGDAETSKPLTTGPVNVLSARIQNVVLKSDSEDEVLIKCVLQSAAEEDYLSPLFFSAAGVGLQPGDRGGWEPFADAEGIRCVPYYYDPTAGGPAQIGSDPNREKFATIFVKGAEQQRSRLLKLPIMANNVLQEEGQRERRFIELTLLDVPRVETVCTMSFSGQQSGLPLEVGKSTAVGGEGAGTVVSCFFRL